jgi:hypothetical protein
VNYYTFIRESRPSMNEFNVFFSGMSGCVNECSPQLDGERV